MTNPNNESTFIVELALLKALAIREHYENYIHYVVYDRLLDETKVFLDAYKNYYELYGDHKEIDFNTFLTQFTTNWHARDMHEDLIKFYTNAILTVRDEPLEDAEAALLGLVNKQLIDKINKIAEKPFTTEQLKQEIEQYEVKRAGILREYDSDVCGLYDVDFSQVDKSNGIPFCHEPLNELGGMVLGSLVLYNAIYGIGKTAEIHTQLAHTLKWKLRVGEDRPVLWFNTEGTSSQVWGRQWSNLYQEVITGGYRDIMKQRDRLRKHFEKKFGNNALWVVKSKGKGLAYIKSKILKYNPCLIILDMASQVMGINQAKNVSDTRTLEFYFDMLREYSALYCPIIATVQAGNGAKVYDKDTHKWKFKKWPDSDDIYGSKSAIQGAAETIITIGRDDEHEFTRYLRTTKLKEDCNPIKFQCELNRKFSDYKLSTSNNRGFNND